MTLRDKQGPDEKDNQSTDTRRGYISDLSFSGTETVCTVSTIISSIEFLTARKSLQKETDKEEEISLFHKNLPY